MALRSVLSDVDEKLVDEERWWRLQTTPPQAGLALDDLAPLPQALASLL